MALYQLTLFYPSVRQHANLLRDIRSSVESTAGKNWRVISAGEHTCAIAFETDLAHDVIRARLGNFNGIEQFQFLLVEVAGVIGGYLSKDVWSWVAAQEIEIKKRKAASAGGS